MDKCPFCKSSDISRARNDSGHFKADEKGKYQPIRKYEYRCNGCGFIATFAKEGQ